jgi:uncharacterized protein YbdZ (MbtH family)
MILRNQEIRIVIVILSLVLSGSFINTDPVSVSRNAEAASSLTQTNHNDFNNGTLDNLVMEGNGPDAELRLYNSPELWSSKVPDGKPTAGEVHEMAPIWGTDKVLLFGGWDSNVDEVNETWVYDLSENTWTDMNPFNRPDGRTGPGLASIYGTKKIFLFGGWNETSYNDTWVYDFEVNNWTKMHPQNSPFARSNHAVASIWGDDKILLFSGSFLSDTWIYDLSENS